MFIKTININGFRSYREQAFDEELSPRNNVIVGRNGSGKSNFFAAIQFVLSEKFANLRANERKELFHVGAGRPALTVYVEIVFDNSDGRLVIPGRPEETEIRIRRTIGLKQDEYRVNDRKFTAEEVRQLLESAGFSASNPYYIVEQGKIVHLANMREEDRYELLKEVAGTRVFEARRAESEALLEESHSRSLKIDESVDQLDARLKELEAETTELRAFQSADKKRKALEFCVYDSELRSAQQSLDDLESKWATTSRMSTEKRDREDVLAREVREAELAADAAIQKMNDLESRRKRVEKERASMASRRALADLKSTEAASAKNREDAERKVLTKEETELNKSIEKSRTDLDAKKKLLAAKRAEFEKTQGDLSKDETRLSVLQAKRGRQGQFSSKADRDKWIKEELTRSRDLIKSNEKELDRLGSEMTKVNKQKAALQAAMSKEESAVNKTEAAFVGHEKDRKEALKKRDTLNSDRRKLWQQISEQEAVVRRREEEGQRARNRLDKATRLDIRQGVVSLGEVLQEINDPSLSKAVHGQLIELMEVDPEYATAVEVTAGNTLFHVVVDSFDVSARILDHMNKRKKPGRLSFFPLDTCKARPKDLPTTGEYSPLFSHVKHHAKFKSVFAEVFGRTLLARTLEGGAAAVSQFDTDAITMEGDQFNRKGGITGGFVDRRNMKLLAFSDSKKAKTATSVEKATLDNLCQKVTTVEQEITTAMQQLEQLSSQDNNARVSAADGVEDIRNAEEQKDRLARLETQHTRAVESIKRTNNGLASTVKALESELKTELQQKLTADDEKELDKLQSSVGSARANVSSAQTKAVAIATEVELLADTVHYLERRVGDVRERLSALHHRHSGDFNPTQEVSAVDKEIAELEKQLADIDNAIDATAQERRKLEEKLEARRADVLRSTTSMQESKDAVDVAHNTRALQQQKKDDAQAKIRKLGIIPSEAENYTGQSVTKLLQQLKMIHEALKKYGHVNKKALDQYTTLVEARNELHEKREGLKTERQSIDRLIEDLDKQRGEAIERTYKQVQFQFDQVFKELVPADGASGHLQMVKATQKGGDPFSAVRVKVSFGLGAPVSELSQLSGGQKSLVALALIFAIQRSDPAPFYLFDEIDAALDAEYRVSVARLLTKQSETCQFITASFKTEMVEAADLVYGIFFTNKVSRIRAISHEDGVKLLRQAASENSERKRLREDGADDNVA